MPAPQPRPGIMDIVLYVGGESHVHGVAKTHKLSSNEGALGPSPKALAAYAQAAAGLAAYPDGGAVALRQALAARWEVEPHRLVCGAGSDELIMLLVRAYAGPGDEVLYSRHGFLMYPISAMGVGAAPIAAMETPELKPDVDALLAAANERTKLCFITNPNNPTGSYLTKGELAHLRAGLPAGCLLVIDGAYAEYADGGAEDYSCGMGLARMRDDVVVTRTFSKLYGLAAVRLGWAYCPGDVADVLNRIRGPFNVSSPAAAAGIAALGDHEHETATRAHNDRFRPWLADKLTAMGLKVYPSLANFLLVQFPQTPGRTAQDVDKHLKQRGVIVRRMESYGLPDCLRITVGPEEALHACVAALAEIF